MIDLLKRIAVRAWRPVLLLMCAALLVGASCPKPGLPPVIAYITPDAGPSGTIVSVTGERFGIGGKVLFDNAEVPSQGTGSPLVFTVPYNTAPGKYEVFVRIPRPGTEKTYDSEPVIFNCTATEIPPALDAEGYEIGYYVLLNAAMEDVMEFVVFGSGFDTNCRVLFDGTPAKPSFLPGIPKGSGTGLLYGGVMTFQDYPRTRYENAIMAVLSSSAGNLPALGSTHTASVDNPISGRTSGQISVTVPSRRVLVEMDRVHSVDWPPCVIWRDNTINTLRRAYTEAGILIDPRWDRTVSDPQLNSVTNTSIYSDSDVVDFFNDHSSMASKVFSGEWYVHVGLLTETPPPAPDWVTLGQMYDATNRQGLAVFVSSIAGDQQEYLRTLAHELGHCFNLTHCEGDAVFSTDPYGALVLQTAGTTLMNQSAHIDATDWVYTFSNDSRTHLSTHPLTEVAPGPGNLAYNAQGRTFGECDR